MTRILRLLAPYAIAVLVPSAILGVLYALNGRSPLWGLVGGGIGLIGALLATATRVLLAPKMGESEVEALARELDEQERWEDTAHGHEGLRRLHEDVARDEERRRDE
jgi:hypothetical protein